MSDVMVELAYTPVGRLHHGDAFHWRRGRHSGWLQARTAAPDGSWVTGTDKNGLVRTVRDGHITRIDRRRKVWDPPDEIRKQYQPRPRKGR